MKKLLRKLYDNSCILKIYAKIHNIFSGNSAKILWGGVHSTALLGKCKYIGKGINNSITINERARLINCKFIFYGNNNKVVIDKKCYLKDVVFWIEDDNNFIKIDEGTYICGKTELACIEGTKIEIGRDCLFSSNIVFRTGDSHSVLDLNGNRINPSKDIFVGNHVWVGQNSFFGKGSCISNNSIVGACAVVTKRFQNKNVVIAGNPAKVVKENIDWCSKRI